MDREVQSSQTSANGQDAPSLVSLVHSLDGVLIVGLALAQFWMTVRWYPLMFQQEFAWGYSGYMKVVSSLVATAVLVVSALLSVKIWRLLTSYAWACAACACCVAGTVLVGCGEIWLGDGLIWSVSTGVLTGVGSSMLLLSWMKACSQRSSILNISLAFLLAVVLLFVLSQVNIAFEASPMRDLTLGVVSVAASVVLLLAGRKGGTVVPPTCHALKDVAGILGKYLGKVCLGAFLVGLSNEIVRIVYYESLASLSASDSSYAIVVLVLVAANAGIAWHISSRQASSFYFLCRMAVILCIAGTLLIPYMDAQGPLLFTLSKAGRQCLQLLLWMMVFTLSTHRRISSVVLFGGIFGAWDLGLFAGYVFHGAIYATEALSGMPVLGIVSITATLLLAVAYVFMFSEKDSDRLFGFTEESPARIRAFSRGCSYLVQKGSLTKREEEVFFLLAKGASVSHIEKKLYISSSTVATHMRHIYQKLDIHSRTELYDLVEQALASLSVEDSSLKGAASKSGTFKTSPRKGNSA